MKNILRCSAPVVLLLLLCASCGTYRKIKYMQDKDSQPEKVYPTKLWENLVRFQPEDVLSISINIPGHQEIAHDFNMPLQPVATTYGSGSYVDMSVGRQTYMVDRNGEILIPIIGRLKVAGYTSAELEEKISRILMEKYVYDVTPVVTARLMNFTIYFLGEVSHRIEITEREHITIFEAIAMGATLGVNASRDVTLIRPQPDGSQKHIKLDLSKIDIVSSPYYYLHQNDMIYVPPTGSSLRSIFMQDIYFFISIPSLMISTIAIILYFRNL